MSTGDQPPLTLGPPAPRARRPARLLRNPARGWAGGVCAGLGDYFRVDPLAFRIAFVVLAAFGGAGVAIYVLAWAVVPAAEGSSAPTLRSRGAALRTLGDAPWREAAGIACLVLAGLLLLREIGFWPGDAIVWPLVLGASGLALVARQAWGTGGDEAATRRRFPLADLDSGSLPGGALGALLLTAAALVFLETTGTLDALREALVGIVVVVAVLVLVFGPWMARQARALAAERTERVRSQERAELAAHLHDSVLQTLALIQRRAGDPRAVSTLARRQERELRTWLAGGASTAEAPSLAAALRAAAEEVEELHGVPVEVVTVGDRPLDERLEALVAAAREALTNAAKFSGAERVDLYAEVAAERVGVFVRDRGRGFDPTDVPEDRRGLRESIAGRMERHGGSARVHAAPGDGTEVELVMEAS